MAAKVFILFTTILLLLATATTTATATATAATAVLAADFIRASCHTTRYPSLCVQCLAVYAPAVHRSPRQLAHAALTVSANRAHAASAFVSRVSSHSTHRSRRGGGAVRDCLETLGDSVDRLRQSVGEMDRRMGRAGSEQFAWHLGNVQTWVSAALTDENTCLDSLKEEGGGAAGAKGAAVRAAIRGKIVDVARVTSNALALVNRLGN